MNKMMGLTKRNILVYFKDKSSILFSMLTPLIVLVLYILFLKGTYVSAIENSAKGLEGFINTADIEKIAAGLLLAGILGTALITIPYNTLMTIVKDKENKVDFDISATPINRVNIILSYFVASAFSAFVMTAAVTTIGLAVMRIDLGFTVAANDLAGIYMIILLGSVSASALFMIAMMFFKTSNASAAFMGLLSAAAGFLIGAYVPLSEFSDSMESVCNLFPATQITVLLKRFLLSDTLFGINEKIGGVDGGTFVDGIKEGFSMNAFFYGRTFEMGCSVAYIFAIIILSVIVISMIYPRIYKRK
ncbi:MAG: ABC transporter permease [Lachnospiraceae bacterium]|nr:ABC transporter permease [Lachnospiraceae bacterium]